MKKLVLFSFLYLVAFGVYAQCPGQAQRTNLLNLQKSQSVEGTLAGQVPLSDNCGNLRYAQYTEAENTPLGFIPTATGNVSNFSEFVIASDSTRWYIDWQGRGYLIDSGGGIVTASNGLTLVVDDVQLGGILTANTTINTVLDGRYLAVTGVNSSGTLGNLRVENTNASGDGTALSITTPTSTGGNGIYVNTTTSGATDTYGIFIEASEAAIYATSLDGYTVAEFQGVGDASRGVYANTTGTTNTSYGLYANAGSGGTALRATASSSAGLAIQATGAGSSPTTPHPIITLNDTNGGGPNGGPTIDFYQNSATSSNRISGRVASLWSDATDVSRTSYLQFYGVNSAGAISQVARFESATVPLLRIASAMGTTGSTSYSNNSITSGATFTVGNSSQLLNIGGSSGQVTISSTLDAVGAININPLSVGAAAVGGVSVGNGTFLQTSGTRNMMDVVTAFAPTSGSAVLNKFAQTGTINQTGGANGIVRGIYLNNTITAAADYRAFESTNGKIRFSDTYSAGSGSLAGSLLDLTQTWNTSGSPTAIKLNVTNTTSGSSANLMDLQVSAVSKFKVDKNGNVTANNVLSGTYTPTVSAEGNLDAPPTMTQAQWHRTGNVVTVSGRFTCDPTTTATNTGFRMSLPIASAFGADEDVAGVAACGTLSSGNSGAIYGVNALDLAFVQWLCVDVASQVWSYTFTYEIM